MNTLKDYYYPVRREQGLQSLDVAIIGGNIGGLVAAAALAQLDFLTVKVYEEAHELGPEAGSLVLPVNALNALYAISPQLCKGVVAGAQSPAAHAHSATAAPRQGVNRSYHRVSSTGADALYTPASRGITGPAAVSAQQMAALCLQNLPRSAVELGHSLSGLHEDSDGVALSFQDRPPVRAKLVMCCAGPASAAARAVQGSALGRGRVALLAPGAAASTPAQPSSQPGLAMEAAVEFAYSISEHGLTPATVRNYIGLMTDRMSSFGQNEGASLPADFYQKAFPPVAQPEALKSAASPPLGSSPVKALKMQEVRGIEPPRGLWSHQAVHAMEPDESVADTETRQVPSFAYIGK